MYARNFYKVFSIYSSLTNFSKVVLRCVVRFVHHSSRTWTGDKVWPPCIDPTAARPTMDLRLLKVAEWVFWQRRTVVKSTMANALRFIFSVKGHKRPMISKSVMNQTILRWWVTEGNCSRQQINQLINQPFFGSILCWSHYLVLLSVHKMLL